jgi:hypothetical protein
MIIRLIRAIFGRKPAPVPTKIVEVARPDQSPVTLVKTTKLSGDQFEHLAGQLAQKHSRDGHKKRRHHKSGSHHKVNGRDHGLRLK